MNETKIMDTQKDWKLDATLTFNVTAVQMNWITEQANERFEGNMSMVLRDLVRMAMIEENRVKDKR